MAPVGWGALRTPAATGIGAGGWQGCHETYFVWARLLLRRIAPKVMPITPSPLKTQAKLSSCLHTPMLSLHPLRSVSLHPGEPFPHVSQVQLSPSSKLSLLENICEVPSAPIHGLYLAWIPVHSRMRHLALSSLGCSVCVLSYATFIKGRTFI